MKRYPFLTVLFPAGALLGALSAAFMVQLSTLPTFECFIPLDMARDAEALFKLKSFLRDCITPGLLASGIFSVWAWLALVRRLNPGFPLLPVLKRHPHKGRTWLAFLAPPLVAGILWLGFNHFWKGMDLWLYSVPAPPFDAKPFLAYLILIFAFIWVVVSPEGWAGPFGVDGGKTQPRYLSCATRGGLFGAAFFAVVLYSIQLRDFLFQLDTEVFHRAPGTSYWEALGLVGVFGLQGAILFTVGFGLAPAFSEGGKVFEPRRWNQAVFPLAVILALAAFHAYSYHRAVDQYGWRCSDLSQAAKTLDPLAPNLVCLTLDETAPFQQKTWPLLAGGITANENNARDLAHFLFAPGNQSRYLEEASLTLPEMGWRLWEPGQTQAWVGRLLLPASPAACRPSVEILQGLLLWLGYSCPLTDANRQLLALISDSQRFQIPPAAVQDISRAWERFGGPKGPAWEGTIQGKVVLRGRQIPPTVKVGLFSTFGEHGNALAGIHFYLPSLSHMTDAQWVGSDGSFRFEHLSKGAYRLAFLVPEEALAGKNPAVDPKGEAGPKPGLLLLSTQKPRINTGTIMIP